MLTPVESAAVNKVSRSLVKSKFVQCEMPNPEHSFNFESLLLPSSWCEIDHLREVITCHNGSVFSCADAMWLFRLLLSGCMQCVSLHRRRWAAGQTDFMMCSCASITLYNLDWMTHLDASLQIKIMCTEVMLRLSSWGTSTFHSSR